MSVAAVTCRACGVRFSAEAATIEEILPFVETAESKGWKLDASKMWRCPDCPASEDR